MAVVASGEATLGEIDARLAELSPVPQWLPIDGDASMTLRQAIDADTSGPLRLSQGGWRDRITGLQYADSTDTLVTVGGLPIKNVAGYDLAKLFVGGHGCFGRIVSVSVRTARRPERALARWIDVPEGQSLPTVVNELLTSPVPPAWLLVTGGGLRAGWHGSSSEIERLQPHVGEGAAERPLADDVEERRLATHRPTRAVVSPAEVAPFAADLRADGLTDWAIDPVHGVAWLAAVAWDVARRAATRRGGHATRYRDDGDLCDGIPDATAAFLRRLKSTLDPTGSLPPLPAGVR